MEANSTRVPILTMKYGLRRREPHNRTGEVCMYEGRVQGVSHVRAQLRARTCVVLSSQAMRGVTEVSAVNVDD